jgi:hypothetical protein
MEDLCINISRHSLDVLSTLLQPKEFADLGLYLARLVETDLRHRRLALLEDAVRQELLRSGASRVFALDIHDFARDPLGLSELISRTGQPCTLTIADKPRLLVQDIRRVARNIADPMTGQ